MDTPPHWGLRLQGTWRAPGLGRAEVGVLIRVQQLGFGREEERRTVSSGGILFSGARSLGWLVESRNRTPHSSKAGACGGERGWGGERSANYVPRRLYISSASALPGLSLLPLVVSQLFRKSSGAPVDRSPRPRCAGMKSRPREFRRPSDANTSIVFTFSLWVWTCVAAFFCSLLPARRSSETAFDPLPQYLAQSRYSVNVCSRKE